MRGVALGLSLAGSAMVAGLALATLNSAPIPQSDRSLAAMERVKPDLMRDVATAGFQWGAPVMIRIFKRESRLELWLEHGGVFRMFRAFDICAWSGKLGPKLKEGDGQSPEGFYHVKPGLMNPNSSFHLSFNLGFPNAYDRAHGRTGSFLMVHGQCSSIGCYAMGAGTAINRDNSPIEQIWTLMTAAFEAGQAAAQVQIYPFEMKEETLAAESSSPWIDFWNNLREGHDLFAATGRPPLVSVDTQKRYAFQPRLP